MISKKILGSMILAGVIAFGGCSEEAKPKKPDEYRRVAGKVCQSDREELIYGDRVALGSAKNIPVPITFLGVEAEGKKHQIILTGPHNLRQGDFVCLDYLVDNEVTGTEIWNRYYPESWNRYYPERSSSLYITPNVRFKVDGYATVWRKE
jgi:hypothetical protein